MAAEIHVITILLGPVAWQFNYLTPSEADKAHKKIAEAMQDEEKFEIEDEFGQKAHIDGACVTAHQRCNLEASMEASSAIEMVRMRAGAEFQRKLQTDPTMMFLRGSMVNGKGLVVPRN